MKKVRSVFLYGIISVLACIPIMLRAAEYSVTKDLIKAQFMSGNIKCKKEDSIYFSVPQQPKAAPAQKVLIYKDNPPSLQYENPLYEKILVAGKDGRERIQETTEWPHRFYGHMAMNFPDGQYAGSCVLVGPHHVLTCAHNVYNFKTRQWAERITIRFALNDDQAPFGEVEVVRIYLDARYISTGDRRFDVALVVIGNSIGHDIGWSGLMYLPDEKLMKKRVSISGYPGDKGGKQMWTMKNKMKNIEDELIFYDIDTYFGQSGSAVWLEKLSNPYVIGIHTMGWGILGEGNSGTRLSLPKLKVIVKK